MRPSKLTKEVCEKICSELRLGCTLGKSANRRKRGRKMKVYVSFETFCNYDVEITEDGIIVTDKHGDSKTAKLGETVEFRGGDDCFTPYEEDKKEGEK